MGSDSAVNKKQTIKRYFYRVSFPNEADNSLYGHLTPKLLLQEMHALVGKKKSKGFKIVVTHLKPPTSNMIKIKEQLVQANDLELDLHFPEQGVRFEL
jgi:3',5'-cyclic-nucleotide phosphodiesterase